MWRKQYHVLQDALKLSGFGWDGTEKMITVDSDDVWDNFVRTHSDAKGMRNKPMSYYEDWLHLFGKDRATGDLVEGAADAAAAMDQEDATVEQQGESPVAQFTSATMDFSMSGNGGQSATAPFSCNVAGKKRGRSDGVTKGLSELANAFGTFFAATNASMVEIVQGISYNQNLSLQRQRVNAELMDHPLDWNQRLRAATMIVQEAQRVDLFFSFPKEDQVEWVALLLGGYI